MNEHDPQFESSFMDDYFAECDEHLTEIRRVLEAADTALAPAALEDLFESTIPGFGELFRWLSYQEIGPATILSRACAGIVTRKILWPGEREQVRTIAAYGALHLLFKSLTD